MVESEKPKPFLDANGHRLPGSVAQKLSVPINGVPRSFGLWDQLTKVDLRSTVPALQIPVYFLEGQYDYTCATALARDYFEHLQAPVKGFYVFDNSAHSPLLEEPLEAHRFLEHDVLAGVTTLADLR